jgi:transcription factor IIIB 90 kDa subunit
MATEESATGLVNLSKTALAKAQRKKVPNRIREIQETNWRRKQLAAAAASSSRTASGSRIQCKNKACPDPNVVDGTCRTCGRVADDTNIVAEVSFGENAQGGAVVQGSYIGADQGGIRPSGGFAPRRIAGGGSWEARERTRREARQTMNVYAQALGQGMVTEEAIHMGHHFYKLASGANFVQGRRNADVIAVCLYAACRRLRPCRVMLLELADVVKTDVFYLGRVFKKLLSDVPTVGDGMPPIFVEDLVISFASRLEFGTDTNKIAETAVRLVQRMDRDWMVMGRRPAGICGACLVMAARMYNYRRTVREVVYIAKVTMATLQTRLEEFKELPSAQLTVEEFLSQDFLLEHFDPPAIYKKREDYQARLREQRLVTRRKRTAQDDKEKDTQSKKQKISAASNMRTDSDGFVVPPIPQRDSQDAAIIEQAVGSESSQMDVIAAEYGDGPQSPEEEAENSPAESPVHVAAQSGQVTAKGRANETASFMNEAWEEDEDILGMEMNEALRTAPTGAVEAAYEESRRRARDRGETPAVIPGYVDAPLEPVEEAHLEELDNPDIGDDELEDDPDVADSMHSDQDQRAKQQTWLQQNEDHLRRAQEKLFKAKQQANGPEKQTRRRIKKPRMGEGQTTPASTPGAAIAQVMEARKFSKKINYNAWASMFDKRKRGPGSVVSEYTSRQTSVAGSDVGSPTQGRSREASVQGNEAGRSGSGDEHRQESDDDGVEEASDDEGEEDIDPFASDDGHEDDEEDEEEQDEE